MFSCASFPNSWVWTWRNWRKLKKMLGWEMEAWAVWQVKWGEGSLTRSTQGPRAALLHLLHLGLPAAVGQHTDLSPSAASIQEVPLCLTCWAVAERGPLKPCSSPPCKTSHFAEVPQQLSHRQIAALICLSQGTAGDVLPDTEEAPELIFIRAALG